MNSRNGNTVTWKSYNMPATINGSGGVSTTFSYAPDRQRFKEVANYAGGTETTYFVGGVLEKVIGLSVTHYKHYIAGPDGYVAAYTRRDNATEDTIYFTHDHLNSIDSVSNAAGVVQAYLAYDAFGARRNAATWSGAAPTADMTVVANTSRRGFTEHEMLDNLGLIHMNGRIQDPVLGRFLSADPFIADLSASQALNRYSYVRNNPLTRVDPSGFVDTVKGPEDGCSSFLCVDLSVGWGVWAGSISGLGYGSGLLSFSYNVSSAWMSDQGRNPESIARDPNVERYNQQLAEANRSESCGQEYCQPSLLADPQFYQDLAANTYREFITEPVKAALATAAAVATGDPGAITRAAANTVCEVSKICDGLKSWVKNIKGIRELVHDAKRAAKTCCFVAGTLVLTTARASAGTPTNCPA